MTAEGRWLRTLVAGALRARRVVLLSVAALLTWALLAALPSLPVDLYPNVAQGGASVSVDAPGLSSAEVERRIALPLEAALRDMDGLRSLELRSRSAALSCDAIFAEGRNHDRLFDELRLRTGQALRGVEAGTAGGLRHVVERFETDAWMPLLRINLLDSGGDAARLRLAEAALALARRLEALPGVRRIMVDGAAAAECRIEVDPALLVRNRLEFSDVAVALQRRGRSAPEGSAAVARGTARVETAPAWTGAEDVLASVLPAEGRRLSDIALPASGIVAADEEVRLSIQGRRAVSLRVLKSAGADARTVRDAVVAEAQAFATDRGPWLGVAVGDDSTIPIRDSLSILGGDLLIGCVLVMAVLGVGIGTGRRRLPAFVIGSAAASLIAAGVLPVSGQVAVALAAMIAVGALCPVALLPVAGLITSVAGAVTVLQALGCSLNEVTIFAFALISGVLVDDAIVVVDAIRRRIEQGDPPARAVVEAVATVGRPVVAAALVLTAAFLPLLADGGPYARFFALIPLVVVVALAVGLLECLVAMPVHAVELAHWFGPAALGRSGAGSAAWTRPLRRLLAAALRRPVIAILGILAILAGAAALVVQTLTAHASGRPALIASRFLPQEADNLVVLVDLDAEATLAATDAAVRHVAELLAGDPLVASTTGLAGLSCDPGRTAVAARQSGTVFAQLVPRTARPDRPSEELLAGVGDRLSRAMAGNGPRLRVRTLAPEVAAGPAVAVWLSGDDRGKLDACAAALRAQVGAGLPGLAPGSGAEVRQPTPAVQILGMRWDDAALVRHGIARDRADLMVQAACAGIPVGTVAGPGGRPVPVRLQLQTAFRDDPVRLLGLPASSVATASPTLGDLGGVLTLRDGESELLRYGGTPARELAIQLPPGAQATPGAVAAAVERWFAAEGVAWPGVRLAIGGRAAEEQRGAAGFLAAGAVAAVAILGVLVWQFRSFRLPLLVIGTVAVSAAGVILVLAGSALLRSVLPEGWIREERSWFTAGTMVAMLGLGGMAANEATLLVDAIHRRRTGGRQALARSLLAGADERMRSVLMTSSTTMAGLLPLAAGLPGFHPLWSSFGACVLGGLACATAATLVAVPVGYLLLMPRLSPPEEDPLAEVAPAALVPVAPRQPLAEPVVFVVLPSGEEVRFTIAELRELRACGDLTGDRLVRTPAMERPVPLSQAAGYLPREIEADFSVVATDREPRP